MAWDQDLAAAFTIMLGRPVDDFDAGREYVLYYLNSLSPDLALSPDWEFDQDRSVFEIEFLEESALAEALGARPDSNKVADAVRTVSGRELAGHGFTRAALAGDDVSVTVAHRVVTGGSLHDALLTAIRGRRGPDGLRPAPAERLEAIFPVPESPPPAEFDTIEDPRLREHLWSPYLDRPWDPGGKPLSRDFLPGEPVGVWDLAYFGEISLVVTAVEPGCSG
ncbi:hypothetical protein Q0Z83_028240 [Actinoplanes sichuanensis]|uniref:Uncharacterized protein n=1 Tax=Actinoplanes sichuanensis TaxID=512349 RepID=A0ABW4ATJ9_9ACTN|nr:hypothetical protein [Actinoplanes sichuanensis]BEL04633.1 hypothetical protein Q0Z83_028240 [Actinoplanes sichuanensis]